MKKHDFTQHNFVFLNEWIKQDLFCHTSVLARIQFSTKPYFCSDLNIITYVWANILCFVILMETQIIMDDHSSISSLLGGKIFISHTIYHGMSKWARSFLSCLHKWFVEVCQKNLRAIVFKLSFVKKGCGTLNNSIKSLVNSR